MTLPTVAKTSLLILTLSLILTVAGFSTGSRVILDAIGFDISNPANSAINLSSFILSIQGILSLTTVIGATIVVGLLTRSKPTNILVLPFALILLTFVGDIIGISTHAFATYDAWVGWIVIIIMSLIAFIHAFAVMDWWSSK